MRLFVVLLAILTLAVRWGDAACGCAAHHHGFDVLSAGHAAGDHCHHDDRSLPQEDSSHAAATLSHGCAGDADADYVPGVRPSLAALPAELPSSVSDGDRPAFLASVDGVAPAGPPSRAVLNVYRI